MILIALGANLSSRYGSAYQTLETAKRELCKSGEIRILKDSRYWLTAPVPVSDQPWFHNAVIEVETELSPLALLDVLQNIEHDFGRVRTVRNAPRILDLDLIAYHDEILNKPELIVPHPRMHKRAFVLCPLHDIAPDWKHPMLDEPLENLIAQIPADQAAEPFDPEKHGQDECLSA